MPIPREERYGVINAAAQLSWSFGEEEKWPVYIKSPFKFRTYYNRPKNIEKISVDKLLNLTDAVIDFDVLYEEIADKYRYHTSNMMNVVVELYFNPTYAAECPIGDVLKKFILSHTNDLFYCIFNYDHCLYDSDAFFNKIKSLFKELSLDILLFMNSINGYYFHVIYTRVYNSSRNINQWWNFIYEYLPVMCEDSAVFVKKYFAPYDYYKPTNNSGGNDIPISVLTYGTPEEVIDFINTDSYIERFRGFHSCVRSDGIKIPLENIKRPKHTWRMYITWGLLRDEDIFNLPDHGIMIYNIIINLLQTNRSRDTIKIRPDFENVKNESSIPIDMIASHENKQMSLEGVISFATAIDHTNHWLPGDIEKLKKAIDNYYCNGIEEIPTEFMNCNVHPNFRAINGGSAYFIYRGHHFISEDITYPEYLEIHHNINVVTANSDDMKYKHYLYVKDRIMNEKNIFMLCAIRKGIIMDICRIIRAFV